MKHYIYIVFTLIAFLSLTQAQIPIPDRPLGFQYGCEGQSLIQLDVFLDLLCPYSKASFPVLLEVADHYGVSNLRLNVLIFPLPYHRSSWLAAQSTHIINEMNSEVTFQWMSDMFAVMEEFYNDQTLNKSDSDIMSMLARVAGNVVDHSKFLSALKNGEGYNEARIMWKYSCSRTISGTPLFLLNGVGMDANAAWTVDDWKSVIDPLLGKKAIKRLLMSARKHNM